MHVRHSYASPIGADVLTVYRQSVNLMIAHDTVSPLIPGDVAAFWLSCRLYQFRYETNGLQVLFHLPCHAKSSERELRRSTDVPRPMGAQLTLFSSNDAGVPQGLRYQPDFISAAEERELIERFRTLPLAPFQFGAFEGKRRVASFGWRYDYAEQKLEKAHELPAWLEPFIARIAASGELPASSIRQVLCTEYDVGVSIGWHRDKPHFAEVFGLSLASACKFRFRRKAGAKWERFTLDAQPRSLYRMSGPARHVWEHSIPPVELRRYSITFRTMAADTPHRGRPA